jgi:acid phosphatase type 7
VVLSGHGHDYERFAPQTSSGVADPARGIREFVVGTGGRSLRAFGTIRANSEVRNSDTYGVLKLTLHTSSYEWQFVPEAGKTFSDSGSGSCH